MELYETDSGALICNSCAIYGNSSSVGTPHYLAYVQVQEASGTSSTSLARTALAEPS